MRGKKESTLTSIYEITNWSSVAPFLAWTLAVSAIAKAIFGSFPAAELKHHFALRDNPRRQRIGRLNWEVSQRTQWNDDIARGSQHAAPVRLTDSEVESKRKELMPLMRVSVFYRAVTYLSNCWACQTFWSALGVYAITQGVADVRAWLFSAVAYSGAAVVLMAVTGAGRSSPPNGKAEGTGTCKTCGGHS